MISKPESKSYTGYQHGGATSSGPAKRLAKPISPKVLRTLISEMEGLKRRIAQMEATQKASVGTYRASQSLLDIRPRRQPPEGMTAMEAVMGKMDIKESPEELLAMLKALD